MGESTNESIPPEALRELGVVLDARGFPEAWSHGAFLASWAVVAFDEPRSLEGDLKAISRSNRALFELAAKLHEHARRYQETGKPIVEREAVALAERIKNLTPHFDGRADNIAFLAGVCLTLQEGQAAGEVFTVPVRWEAGEAFRVLAMATAALKAAGFADATPARRYRVQSYEAPPERDEAARWWRTVTLAVPAELQFRGPDSALGVRSAEWLHRQCEAVARERARRDFPPGSPASRMYDGGDFAIPIPIPILDPVEPVRDGPPVSVVPAPVEDTIAEYIKRAASCPDHWDALEVAVKVLRQCGQPLGDPLTDWVVQRSGRSNGRKAAKAPAHALRNHAIIAAVRALERCGMKATRNEVSIPNSACDAAAKAFFLTYDTVRGIWKNRLRPGKQGISCG